MKHVLSIYFFVACLQALAQTTQQPLHIRVTGEAVVKVVPDYVIPGIL